MLLTEKKLRRLISLMLEQGNTTSDLSKWKMATEFSPSEKAYKDIYKHEAFVPFMYDDKGGRIGPNTFKRLLKISVKRVLKKIIDTDKDREKKAEKAGMAVASLREEAKKEEEAKKDIYSMGNTVKGVIIPDDDYVIEKVIEAVLSSTLIKQVKKDLRNYSRPIFNLDLNIPPVNGYLTVGVGHLVYKDGEIDEREKWKKYTFDSMIEAFILKANSTRFSLVPNFDDFLLSKAGGYNLFKDDVKKHTQFDKSITRPITQEMFDALTSLAFNAGWEEHRPIKYVIKRINKGQYVSAQEKIKTTAITTGGDESSMIASRREEESKRFGEGGTKLDYSKWSVESVLDPGETEAPAGSGSDFSKFM